MTGHEQKPITIGVSTSALFDMQESDWVFRTKGESYYEHYMREREAEPFKPGLFFESAKMHKAISDACGHDLTRISLMSRNGGWTGIRAVKSCAHHGVPFLNAAFTRGTSPVPYLQAYGIDLFVSTRMDDVDAAVNMMGVAAFQAQGVLPPIDERRLSRIFKAKAAPTSAFAREYSVPDNFSGRLHLVFDLDRVVFNHEADEKFDPDDMESYLAHERERHDEPLSGGPFEKIALKFSELARRFPRGATPFVVSVLTARGGDAALRALNSLRAMGIYVNGELHMVGGGLLREGRMVPINPEKARVLAVMRAANDHVIEFYDDSATTIRHTREVGGVLSGLVPRQKNTGIRTLMDATASSLLPK